MQKTPAKLSSAAKNKIWTKDGCISNCHTFSILHVHFGQIQYFSEVFTTDLTNQYCVGTLGEANDCNLFYLTTKKVFWRFQNIFKFRGENCLVCPPPVAGPDRDKNKTMAGSWMECFAETTLGYAHETNFKRLSHSFNSVLYQRHGHNAYEHRTAFVSG